MSVLDLDGSDRIRFNWTTLITSSTWAIICKPTALPASFAGLLLQHRPGTAVRGGLFCNSDGSVSYINDNNSGDSPAAEIDDAGDWYIVCVTKTGGSTVPRYHVYNFTTNTWIHGTVNSSVADVTDGAGTAEVHVGDFQNSGFFTGRVAAAAVWASALSDANVEQLSSNHDSADWIGTQNASLASFWELNTLSVITDQKGTNDEIDRTGTTLVDGDDPGGDWTFITGGDPHLNVTATALNFLATTETDPDDQSFDVENDGAGGSSLSYEITESSPWLAVDPTSGGPLSGGASDSILASVTVADVPGPTGEIFMAPDGDDANDGSSTGLAVLTFERAAELAVPGTIVSVLPGTYDPGTADVDGSESNRIRWVSVEKYGAKFETGMQCLGDYNDFVDFECVGGAGRDGILLDGIFSRIIGCLVHDFDSIEDSIGGSGIQLGGVSDYLGHHLQAIGCHVHHVGGASIGNPSSHIGPVYVQTPFAVVTNTLIHDCSSQGISTWHAATEVVFINNTSVRNGIGILLGNGDSGAPPEGCINCYIANNICYDNVSDGINEQSSAHENIFMNNTLFGNGNDDFVPAGAGSQDGLLNTDPEFFSDLTDFHLRATSPSAGSAFIDGNVPPVDFNWQERDIAGSDVDRGAFQGEAGTVRTTPLIYGTTITVEEV